MCADDLTLSNLEDLFQKLKDYKLCGVGVLGKNTVNVIYFGQ
jgi:hypothetical protein